MTATLDSPAAVAGTCKVCKREGEFPVRDKKKVYCPNCGTVKQSQIVPTGEGLKGGTTSERVTAAPKREEKKSHKEIVDAVADLIQKHGDNFRNWPDYAEILLGVGLTPAQITQAIWHAADKQSTNALVDYLNDLNSENGRLHCTTFNGAPLDKPRIAPDTIPEPKTETQQAEEKIMNVSKTDARNLLVAMGKPAAKWSAKKCTAVLNKIEKLLDGAKEPEDKETVALLRKIGQAVQDGEKVVVEDSSEKKRKAAKAHAESNGKAHPDKKGKGAKKKKEGMSGLDAALAVLKASQKPLSKTEIMERIEAKGLWKTDGKTPADTIKAAIHTEIKKKGKEARFAHAERGLFTVSGR